MLSPQAILCSQFCLFIWGSILCWKTSSCFYPGPPSLAVFLADLCLGLLEKAVCLSSLSNHRVRLCFWLCPLPLSHLTSLDHWIQTPPSQHPFSSFCGTEQGCPSIFLQLRSREAEAVPGLTTRKRSQRDQGFFLTPSLALKAWEPAPAQ